MKKTANKKNAKPCRECPWRKCSVRAWFGGDNDAEEYLRAAHGEEIIPCHLRNAQCVGAAIYRANVFKLPRNPKALILPKSPDVFETRDQFVKHHIESFWPKPDPSR